jgi:hypothetical protein
LRSLTPSASTSTTVSGSPKSPVSPGQSPLNIPQTITPLSITSDEGDGSYVTADEEGAAGVAGRGGAQKNEDEPPSELKVKGPEVIIGRPSGEEDRDTKKDGSGYAASQAETDRVKQRCMVGHEPESGTVEPVKSGLNEQETRPEEEIRPEPERKESSGSMSGLKGMMGRLGFGQERKS